MLLKSILVASTKVLSLLVSPATTFELLSNSTTSIIDIYSFLVGLNSYPCCLNLFLIVVRPIPISLHVLVNVLPSKSLLLIYCICSLIGKLSNVYLSMFKPPK
ncbi:putative membrane protein [Clostridioides difficile P1]|nr:putative membrane protein [Clostridioides difficile P1]EQJ75631.1 putative membrane protein [Clostridioides difficile P46]ERM52452.1 putative membrane protein [Clostridioides difficile P68]